MTKRSYVVHFMTYSLDARSSGGNVENIRYENSLYRSLIHYHTLLLPIHDFEKEENTSKQFEEEELLVQTF